MSISTTTKSVPEKEKFLSGRHFTRFIKTTSEAIKVDVFNVLMVWSFFLVGVAELFGRQFSWQCYTGMFIILFYSIARDLWLNRYGACESDK